MQWLINKFFARVDKRPPLTTVMNPEHVCHNNCHFTLPYLPAFPNGRFPSAPPTDVYFLSYFYSICASYHITLLVLYFNTLIIEIRVYVRPAFLGLSLGQLKL